MQSIYLVGGGLLIEANIPVQELEGQRGEGAYFREDTVLRLLYFSPYLKKKYINLAWHAQTVNKLIHTIHSVTIEKGAQNNGTNQNTFI